MAKPKVDFTGMVSRSRGVADGMSKGVQFAKKNKIDVIMGNGKLMPGRKVEVTDAEGVKQVVEADQIIIATMPAAASPPPAGRKEDHRLPRGYDDGEAAQEAGRRRVRRHRRRIRLFYNAIGTEVTIVEYMPNIVPVEDEEVSSSRPELQKSGINIMTSSEVTGVDTSGKGCKVHVKTKKGEEVVDADVVLSEGCSNIDGIGLEEVGIAADRGKLIVDDFYKTNIPGYYAIGDCVPGPALAHVAMLRASCGEKIAGHDVDFDYGNNPCARTLPGSRQRGEHEEAREEGIDIKVGKFPFSASGKASAAGHKDGFVKLIFDAKYGELLGGHMIGANVTEMIAEIVAIRKLETTGHEMIKTVHPHPTLSEAVMEAAAAAYDEVIHL